MSETIKPFFLWRHLNKIRWVVLLIVFLMLIMLPFIHVYQTFVASFSYDLLAPTEKTLYDIMEALTAPFTNDPANGLDGIKGTTWSGNFFGYQISDPLSVVGQIAAGLTLYWPFILTALIPVLATVIFGRFFCGWICPATFLYELNTTLSLWLHRAGFKAGNRKFDRRLKYLVLAVGLVLSVISGSVLISVIYPPAIIGRELYFGIALGGFGAGLVFFVITLLFDPIVRGIVAIARGQAVDPVQAEESRQQDDGQQENYRLFRIKRIVENCNDCAKCNAVCEFGLNPLHDDFGQECNNCAACIAVCPTDAMTFITSTKDVPFQGAGHLGKQYKRTLDAGE